MRYAFRIYSYIGLLYEPMIRFDGAIGVARTARIPHGTTASSRLTSYKIGIGNRNSVALPEQNGQVLFAFLGRCALQI